MAARAGSVHLISSMDRKPSWKGGARPRPKQHHPVPQGQPFSIKCRLATGCPPEAHNQSQLKHSFLKAKTHTNTSRPFCHTAHTRAHLISCVGGVTTRHRNHIRFKPSSAKARFEPACFGSTHESPTTRPPLLSLLAILISPILILKTTPQD